MRILYVSPENVTGGFRLFKLGHQRRGNESRFVTFFRSQFGFDEDLCFDLHFMPTRKSVQQVNQGLKKLNGMELNADLPGNPPYWRPASALASLLFRARDVINSPRLNRRIREWGLDDFDVYHFEQGIDPFRDGHWVKKLSGRGKGIVCFYHGSDLRNRGVIETVHRHSRLNLTSEIDLLQQLPGMQYLYLPLDTEAIKPAPREPDGRIRIGHAARNRRLKGSDRIEQVVKGLSQRYPVDWVMIENLPHDQALTVKASCDVFIDQITDAGGWGYGASSVESLAQGIPTLTRINSEVASFLGEHPFVSVTAETLEATLIELIEDPARRRELSEYGQRWVVERHGIDAVMDCLYGYYREAGWL